MMAKMQDHFQSVPLEKQPSNNHVLRYKSEIRTGPPPRNTLSQPHP
jgi:hypothetical protein